MSVPRRDYVSWLIRTGMDRERMLDMDRRIAPVRRNTFLVLALSLIAMGPWIGWWTLLPLGVSAALFSVAERQTARVRRPELAMFGAWVGTQLVITAAVSLSGGPKVPTLSWLAIAVVTLASRFSDRGILAGVAITLLLLLAVGFGVNAKAVLHYPPLLIAPAALVVSVAMFSLALMRSEVEARSKAVVDPLTGLLNRTALESRVEELRQQSRFTRQPAALIVADVDHFKEINDHYGHTRGDAVLKDFAYLLRKRLRAFDLAYRIGGEEFVVLLPGATVDQAASLSYALRQAVEETPLGGGLAVSISVGVAASAEGEPFEFRTVFERADAALYRAKEGGRNQVCIAAVPASQPAPLTGA